MKSAAGLILSLGLLCGAPLAIFLFTSMSEGPQRATDLLVLVPGTSPCSRSVRSRAPPLRGEPCGSHRPRRFARSDVTM